MRTASRERGIGATERVTLSFTPEQRERLERLAGDRNWTCSRVMRDALDIYLAQLAAEAEVATAA